MDEGCIKVDRMKNIKQQENKKENGRMAFDGAFFENTSLG